jgi:hypothetical protein
MLRTKPAPRIGAPLRPRLGAPPRFLGAPQETCGLGLFICAKSCLHALETTLQDKERQHVAEVDELTSTGEHQKSEIRQRDVVLRKLQDRQEARRGGSNRRKGPDEEFSVMTERYSGSDCAKRESWPNHQ